MVEIDLQHQELWETYPASGRPSRLIMSGTYEEINRYIADHNGVLPIAGGNYEVVEEGMVLADEKGYLFFDW